MYRRTSMRWSSSDRLTAAGPVVGVLATLTYVVMPSDNARALFIVLVGTAAVALLVWGAVRARAVSGGAWLILAAGQLLWVAGDTCYGFAQLRTGVHTYPSLPDFFYIAAYPLLTVGVFRLGRGWRARDSARLLDTAIITLALALAYWIMVAGPVVFDSDLSVLNRIYTVAYPVVAAALVAVTVPMWLRREYRTPSVWLLLLGATATMAFTVIYSLVPAPTALLTRVSIGGFIVAYVCFACAAVHPSARAEDASSEVAPPFTLARLLMLTAASVLPGGMLIVEWGRGRDTMHWLAAAVGSVVMSLLVMARLAGFVSQTRRQSRQLRELAMRDELTGLPNRRSFEDSLADALGRSRPHVMLLDLNGFKTVNDHFGHAVGDRLLIVVAQRLSEVLREEDVVARMGGDEFAVLIGNAPTSVIDSVAARLADAVRQPIEVAGHQLMISTSIGTVDAAGIDEPYEIMRRADLAMYDAKRQRRNRHQWYDPGLDEHTRWRTQIAEELRSALNTEQLHVVYQPIVSLPEGRTVSVEALLRWQHPTRGPVSPADFIPVAEESGIIVELGEAVLQAACAQAATWRTTLGAAAPERISVNVSARQLAEPEFPQTVARILAGFGWAAHNLVCEVTETAVFGSDQSVRAVHELHQLGVRIALDDFGTGHSSLGLLKAIPVDILKVDKSFVDNITMAGRHAVIAAALIDISRGLGLSAVAEGVETAEQAAKLYDLGYRLAQGYYFGRPSVQPDFTATAIPSSSGH